MNTIETVAAQCPYCGENIELVVDGSAGDQRYIEDCEVCCQAISIALTCDEELGVRVDVFSENDVF
ncbi:Uncharacterised protein [Zhongshania aliphaticivorans]|uniref:CPXCG motif-containing cysteine-rich protein n=1 Tax=Zhongshania aliphaticivorans TaxID=1470434 RepID=A0A5S9MS46_9GAMM|nr:CPXCG motif-containing cysteine-rich protein [Zhongshania aliphaticivorans]CAA0080012.1 Uncharacterised protein [Zhongshania aliphaticivorans]CAA0085890.1 Uncharacterised protein [Zhongshania aliphaticivorans]